MTRFNVARMEARLEALTSGADSKDIFLRLPTGVQIAMSGPQLLDACEDVIRDVPSQGAQIVKTAVAVKGTRVLDLLHMIIDN